MALVALTLNELTPPRRIEGHTSNVVAPIELSELGPIAVGTLTAGDTFVIPTQLNKINDVSITGTNAGGSVVVHAAPGELAISAEAIGANALAGSDTLTLGASASAVDDVYNGCMIEIHYGATVQTLKILDYDGGTKVATMDGTTDTDAATATTLYAVRGIVVTSEAGATTPSYSVSVTGLTV